jgi:hypothetical protein
MLNVGQEFQSITLDPLYVTFLNSKGAIAPLHHRAYFVVMGLR